MALPIQTSTRTGVPLPLACDPSVQAANDPARNPELAVRGEALPESPLPLYLRTSDATLLKIPADATVATCRALSKPERKAVDAAANAGGYYREQDRQLYVHVLEVAGDWVARGAVLIEAAQAQARATLGDRKDASDLDPSERRAIVWLANVTAETLRAISAAGELALGQLAREERAQFDAFSAWRERRDRETVRLGVMRLTNPGSPDLVADSHGFPVEALVATPLEERVIAELAQHVRNLSDEGKALAQPSCATSSGGAPTSPSTTNAQLWTACHATGACPPIAAS